MTRLFCSTILIALLALTGCANLNDFTLLLAHQPAPPTSGDPIRGEQLFKAGVEGAPPCSGCHQTIEGGTGFSLGPNLADISSRAAARIEGMSAEHYLVDSILHPASHIIPGYHVSMFTDYATYLSQQDMADLIAYLMTL